MEHEQPFTPNLDYTPPSAEEIEAHLNAVHPHLNTMTPAELDQLAHDTHQP